VVFPVRDRVEQELPPRADAVAEAVVEGDVVNPRPDPAGRGGALVHARARAAPLVDHPAGVVALESADHRPHSEVLGLGFVPILRPVAAQLPPHLLAAGTAAVE